MKQILLNELKMMFGFSRARLNRVRYISYCGFFFALSFILFTLIILPSVKLDNLTQNVGFTFVTIILLGLVSFVFAIWWATRRLHDMNLSAKWLFLWLVFPCVIVMQKIFMFADIQGMLLIFSIAAILHLLVAILLMSVAGTRGTNRFGEKPPKNTYINYVFFVVFFVFIIFAPVWKMMQMKKVVTEITKQNSVQMQDKEKGQPLRIP